MPAGSSGPDLTVARAAVTKLMDDTCTIVRPEALSGLELDQATGALAADPAAAVYSGPCKIRPDDAQSRWEELGALNVEQARWTGAIPGDSGADVQPGDLWTHTASRRDPLLVGRSFIVKHVAYSTFMVQRRVQLEEVQP